jgi:CubicO group peptidase (beta-lactamase class C family)
MRRLNSLAFLLAAQLLLSAATRAQDFERARALIREQVTERGVPGIAVAVARDGKFLWEEGFGWADRERRIPATEHTMFSLASISKPITATGLMVLVERGRIELDKPINDYLGTAKVTARVGSATEATVRRVAGHTAGLGLHYQFLYEDEPYRVPSMDDTVLRYAHIFFEPGTRYQYSNLGYGLLDYVIERVSSRPYADFMRQEVFIPLGLTRMSVGIGPRLAEHAAVRYNRECTPLPFYDFDHRGASAIFASAHDLVRFGMFHLKLRLPDQKAILKDAAIDEMQRPGMNNYGIGWSIVEPQGFRVVTHGGGMPGVTTTLVLVPAHRICIAVLANTSGAQITAIVQEILKTLVPNLPPLPRSPQTEPPEFKPRPELVGEWTGAIHTYLGERPVVLRIEESGTIRVRLREQLWTLLTRVTFSEGILVGRFAGDVDTTDASRKPHTISLTLKLRGDILNGSAASISLGDARGANAQSHWIELKKQPSKGQASQ